ncbi:autotransporter outer membrane beta-barrel domain-containing protein [Mesorhizobium sp. NZP2298]|uniref:autotransporter outer membrane beta-barrel domain-containing protein n=1 Tax=Mesorhizobium sp. NZP2298 TaxID=2483403 RepID=UPI0015581D9A|nr:autotransporter outer membrane beta-barrel domain-containing protein [Mesorhizobium sp. NZP2298]QKC95896.1 autotransporter outer membrane beta-barrel domain-containing protein [Mesorhizobium sp. NZP2298]
MAGQILGGDRLLDGGRRRLLAGASCAVLMLACGLPGAALAATYYVSTEGQLRTAVTAANADGDASATIILTTNITMVNSGSPDTAAKPITIDTQGFTLSGSGIQALTLPTTGSMYTLVGNFKGSDGAASSSAGVQASFGSSMTNNGTIQGGNSQTGGGGPGVLVGTSGGAKTFVNNGTIRGGTGPANGVGSSGAGIFVRNATTNPIVNTGTGTIEGGAGAAAIVLNQATSAYSFVNSGTIKAGAGANAIQWSSSVTPTTGSLTLELQAGSVIEGNVVANANALTDTLRLGGTTNAAFDVSAIGATAQYRNFDTFQKTGTSTWTLTGTGTATTNWDIQQGTLQLGNGGTSGSIIGDVNNNGTFAFNRSNELTYGGIISGSGMVRQIGGGTTILTGANTYSGGTAIDGGTLQVSEDGNLGAASGSLTFDGGTLRTTASFATNRDVLISSTGGFDTAAGTQLDLSGQVTGSGMLVKNGAGTLNVTSYSNNYTGGTVVNAGTLAGNTVAIRGDILNNGAVSFLDLGPNTFSGNISGTGSLDVEGIGTLTLTGTNTHSGGTTVGVGKSISVASDQNLGAATGLLTLDGGELGTTASFAMSRDISLTAAYGYFRTATGTTLTVNGELSGAGGLYKEGAGTMVLNGDSIYTGRTTVDSGKLVVEGSLGNTETTVNSGGTLGGSGSIGGAVIVADGGTLAPGSSPGTLTIGSLSLSSGSTLDYELGQAGVVGGGVNDLIVVTGALTLDGSLDITDVGGFGPGVYRLINYGGALTDNGLELGDLPVGVTAADLTVQTSVANQVNLISSVGNDLLFWDGDAAGNANNDLVDGGNGTWTATSLNWTTSTGLVDAAMKPQPGFAIFQTLGGIVTADDGAGALEVTGMQFAADGYRIEGDAITLAGAGGESIIRVGDGTVAGAGYTATIASVLTGASSLTKTDAGTLVLSGANTYTGGTNVSGGVLSVAADNNLGDAAGGLTLSSGTLRNTAAFSSARGVTLSAAGGTFDTVADLTLSGAISGAGSLAKTGSGTLTLTGANSYGGNTLVDAGTLIGNAASIRGDIGNAGTVVLDQAADASFAGDISGTGTMVKDGAGALTLTGTSLLDWTIDQGGLVSAAERFGGDVAIGAGASFTFDGEANASYAGVLSGAGTFVKDGLGTVVLASDNSGFTGATSVVGGTLAAGAANAFSSSSQFSVASGATLDLAGTSQTLAGLTNAGTVRIAGGALGNTLTISGDYVGNGGTVVLNTALGGDGSATDMLVIAGGTSGTGTLEVANFGGAGDQTAEGIKIVDIGGVSNGTFSLKGDYTFEGDAAVVAGAYAYRLYQGGVSTPTDGDWYLRSELDNSLLFQAGAPVYEAYAGVLQSFNQLGTLQQRLGNRSWTVEAQGADGISDDVKAEAGIGLWGRIEGASGSYDPESSTTTTTYDTSTWRLQTGADMLLSDSAAGQLIGGIAFQYGTVSADVSSVFGNGSIDSTGTGVSGSLTWYGAEGFYLDGQAQVIWYDSNLDSATAGQRLVDGNNGVGYALGVEAGKRIMLDPSWSLTPQAQLAWSSVDFDAFTDTFGARVTQDSSDSLLGRLGLSLDHQSQWQDHTGRAGHTNLYGIANLYYDFEDGSSVDLAGSSLSSRNEQLWGGLGIGGTVNWADDKFSVFGEAIARTGLEDFGDSHVLTGSLGLRVKW